MGFVWESALKDLRRMLRDPAALLLWLAIPFLIGSLMFLAFGGRGGPRTLVAPLLVVDHDRTGVSRLLVSVLDHMPVIAADTVSEARGRSEIDAGKASALLEIPPGFGDAVLAERPIDLSLRTNPAQRILPAVIRESLEIVFDAAFYAQRLLGEPLRAILAPDPGQSSDAMIGRLGFEASRAAVQLKRFADPSAITFETRVPQGSGEAPSFAALFLPGLLFMTLLFVAEGLAGDLWRERSQGTLRRAVASPRPLVAFLAGKLLAGAIVIIAICAVVMPIYLGLFGLAPGRLPLALAWAVFSGVVFHAGLMLIQLLASSQRTAGILTTMILFPLLMVGGSFFPFESMPEGLARIGRATPNGWALTQLKAILAGTAGPAELLLPLAGLGAVGIACFLLAARRLARGAVLA